MRSTVPTEVPPYFWTMSKAGHFSDSAGPLVKTSVVDSLAMADALELHVTMPDKERATSLARAWSTKAWPRA